MLTVRFTAFDPKRTFSLGGSTGSEKLLATRESESISVEYVRNFDILRARGPPWRRTRDDQQHEAHRIGNPADHRNPLQDYVAIIGRGRVADEENWRAEHCDKQNGRTHPRRPSDIAEAPG